MSMVPRFHHPHRRRLHRDVVADRLVWALIAAVVALNVVVMWGIATGGM